MTHTARKLLTDQMRRRLASARLAAGISQNEIALRIGTAQTAVSYWETGRRTPSLESLVRWCEALGFELSLVIRPIE